MNKVRPGVSQIVRVVCEQMMANAVATVKLFVQSCLPNSNNVAKKTKQNKTKPKTKNKQQQKKPKKETKKKQTNKQTNRNHTKITTPPPTFRNMLPPKQTAQAYMWVLRAPSVFLAHRSILRRQRNMSLKANYMLWLF